MFNSMIFENSRPEGLPTLEIEPGTEKGEAQPRRFVPLRRTELQGEVTGPLASLCLVQVYGFSREQCDRAVEAVYRFPLPGDAAVTGVRVRFGAVEVQTELKERPKAEAEYEAARHEGRQAALLTRESPDVFTLRLAGIEPDQDVIVETSYVQLGRAEAAGWSLRVPLTTAPRFVREDEIGSRQASGQPLLLLRDPGHRFSLDLKVQGAGSVSSPTHGLDLSPDGSATHIRLREGEVVPDRDCVLSWQPAQEREQPSFQIWWHAERTAGEIDFLALLAPPANPQPESGVAREVILVVDHSGSMQGPKWAATDWAVKQFLAGLTPKDSFNLALFHDQTRWFSDRPQPAAAQTVEAAIRFLEEHRDSGGTNLGVALEQALRLPRAEGDHARHVLVMTDAQVSDAGRILRLADEEMKRSDRRRISILCIDAAPNAFLARELAERGGGLARFLTSDPQEEDITTALDEVLADWQQPVLADLQLQINRPEVVAAGHETLSDDDAGQSRIDLGDLPLGRALWVAGRVRRGGTDPLRLELLAPPRREIKARQLDPSELHHQPAIRSLFGAWRIAGLEYLIQAAYQGEELADRLRRLGYDPRRLPADSAGQPPAVYAENAREESLKALRRLLIEESLQSGLICSETAFVAVRREVGKPVEETVLVANALPAGWSEAFLAVPARFAASGPMVMAASLTLDDSCAASPPRQARRGRGMKFKLARLATGLGPHLPSATAAPAAGAVAPLTEPAAAPATVFSGVPPFTGGEVVLFDTARGEDAARLAGIAQITRLLVRFPGGAPKPEALDSGLCLLLFVDDLSQPRARVRLADLVRQGGERPLNIARRADERVRLVLADPAGTWASGAPAIEVELG